MNNLEILSAIALIFILSYIAKKRIEDEIDLYSKYIQYVLVLNNLLASIIIPLIGLPIIFSFIIINLVENIKKNKKFIKYTILFSLIIYVLLVIIWINNNNTNYNELFIIYTISIINIILSIYLI